MKSRHHLLIAAVTLIPTAVLAIFVVSAFVGTPTAAFLVYASWELGIAGVIVYLASALGLFGSLVVASGREEAMGVPWISVSAIATACALIAWYWRQAWSYALEYQGEWTVMTALWLNVCALAAVILLVALRIRQPSFRARLMTHWVLILWLASWAFPYFGEMP